MVLQLKLTSINSPSIFATPGFVIIVLPLIYIGKLHTWISAANNRPRRIKLLDNLNLIP